MFFLKLISPKTLPKRKTDWKFYHKCYRALLKAHVASYCKGAIDDRFIVDGVEVSHTLRDMWFEKELQRFGIGIAPAMTMVQPQDFQKRRYRRSILFDWEEKLTIKHARKDCCIVRDDSVNFSSHFDGQLKASSDRNAFLSLVFEARQKPSRLTESEPQTTDAPSKESEETAKHPDPPKKKRRIHIKDTVDPQQTPQTTEQSQTPQTQDTFVKHNGFEENEIF